MRPGKGARRAQCRGPLHGPAPRLQDRSGVGRRGCGGTTIQSTMAKRRTAGPSRARPACAGDPPAALGLHQPLRRPARGHRRAPPLDGARRPRRPRGPLPPPAKDLPGRRRGASATGTHQSRPRPMLTPRHLGSFHAPLPARVRWPAARGPVVHRACRTPCAGHQADGRRLGRVLRPPAETALHASSRASNARTTRCCIGRPTAKGRAYGPGLGYGHTAVGDDDEETGDRARAERDVVKEYQLRSTVVPALRA